MRFGKKTIVNLEVNPPGFKSHRPKCFQIIHCVINTTLLLHIHDYLKLL